jgi:hypothetical protein
MSSMDNRKVVKEARKSRTRPENGVGGSSFCKSCFKKRAGSSSQRVFVWRNITAAVTTVLTALKSSQYK